MRATGVPTSRPHRRPARRRGALAIATAAALLAGCGGGAGDAGPPADYAATDLATGAPVSLADLRGSPVLLSTWATWCEPCRKEMPQLERLYAERRDDGLVVVAVNVNAAGPDERRIDALVRQWGLTMPLWRDADDRVTAEFGGMGVPMSVLIGADGVERATWHGAVDTADPAFAAEIDGAIAEAS